MIELFIREFRLWRVRRKCKSLGVPDPPFYWDEHAQNFYVSLCERALDHEAALRWMAGEFKEYLRMLKKLGCPVT